MFPFRLETENRVFPVLCLSLVLANILFFLLSQAQYPDGSFPHIYGIHRGQMGIFYWWTSIFSHAGWGHLLGNMWFLWLFGRAVEDDLGPAGFLGLYSLAGIGSCALHLIVDSRENIPLVGASGAIAGLMVSYIVLFPKAEAQVFMDRFTWMIYKAVTYGKRDESGVSHYFFSTGVVSAKWVVALYVVMDLFGGVSSLGSSGGGGTAYWGHIGGYVFGAIMGMVLKPMLRTGMVMSHIKLAPPDVRGGKTKLPEVMGRNPEPEVDLEPTWVNWAALEKILTQDAWPPKLMEFAKTQNREDFLVLLDRIHHAQTMSGNQIRLKQIEAMKKLLGVREG